VEKTIGITGAVAGQYVDSFKSEDLSGIHRIILDLGNPASNTPMGRQAMASEMLQYGAITDPKLYLQLQRTGNVDLATEDTLAENLLIKNHQEQLLQGEVPLVAWTDNHVRFINMALGILNLPETRTDPMKVGAVNQYIQDHIEVSMNTDPMKLLAIGRKPLIQMPMGPMPGAEGEMAPPPGGPVPPPPQPEPGIPPGQKMPKNPQTQQEWNPQTGG